MRFPLRIILLALLLAEIAAFIVVGDTIGVLGTLALVLISMVAGILLLRRQGMAALNHVQADLEARRIPARPLFDGALVALAGLLMVVPGFITDIAGLLLFVPAVRAAIWRWVGGRMRFRRRDAARYAQSDDMIELKAGEYQSRPRADTPWRAGPAD
jgi:UPF0716 protein FxsA